MAIVSSSAAAPIGASRASSSPEVSSAPIVDAALEPAPAGVHAFVELHDRDAGLGLAVDHRPLDRRGAAILRQERGVDVDAAARQRIEHGASAGSCRTRRRPRARRPRRAAPRSSSPVRADFGWITGSPSSGAATFTAGARSSPPRPAGLSGWLTTSATSCAPASARRHGTANSGEPMKTTRIAWRQLDQVREVRERAGDRRAARGTLRRARSRCRRARCASSRRRSSGKHSAAKSRRAD